MGTSDNTFDFASDRHARNGILAASVVIFISSVSLSSLLAPAVIGQDFPLITIIEMIVIFGQILSAVSAWILISRGDVELGALRLAFSFAITGIFRVLVRESIGLPLGVIITITVAAIGYLTLPSDQARRTIILAYGLGGAIILFDLFASNFYGRQVSSELLISAANNLAILVFILQLIILVTQSRYIGLASRIANYFALLTLVAVIVIGYFGIQLVRNRTASGISVTTYALRTLEIAQQGTIITGVIVSFSGAVLGLLIARSLTQPISLLSETALELKAGKLNTRAVLHGADEVNELAVTFNSMAESLEGLVGQLEVRVNERTRDLQRRAIELHTAAEIGHAATTQRDLESLLERTAELITERFGFYHAGIFLLDTAGDYAVLHAASSEGGLAMLRAGHRLRVGEPSIVGFVTQSWKARIALDVGQDAVFFDNPHLPDTHSELAVPLIAGEQILGALDVQSTERDAFHEQDIATLQIVADQLAIAIQNARLFRETQNALDAARMAYGEVSREAWGKIIKNQPRVSYVAGAPGMVQANTAAPTLDVVRTVETGDVIISSDGHTIGIPIKIRGQSIGALRLKKQERSSVWTHDETTLAIALAEQLSGALESARLYRESQQRAARESLVSDISARITALPRVDTILRETVQELGQTFGNTEVTFQLLDLSDERKQAGGSGNGSEPDLLDGGKDKE